MAAKKKVVKEAKKKVLKKKKLDKQFKKEEKVMHEFKEGKEEISSYSNRPFRSA